MKGLTKPLHRSLKTPEEQSSGVFFRALLGTVLLFSLSVGTLADSRCSLVGEAKSFTVAKVSDGDTLRLGSGTRIRVLGINAPEVANKGKPAEALAIESRTAAVKFIANKPVRLVYDQQRQDHYGRHLAHVYNAKGESLATHLLSLGLAFHIPVPPNNAEANCLSKVARQAKAAKRGIWGNNRWKARNVSSLKPNETGFMRIAGKVTKLDENRDVWLELDGDLVLKISAADKRYFKGSEWRRWKGKQVDVYGWVTQRKNSASNSRMKSRVLAVRTPYVIDIK